MRLWNVGDTSEGICRKCKSLSPTIFAERTIRLEKSRVKVERVLVAVCATCDELVAIAPQSTPQLKEAREKQPSFMRARVNRRLDDALRLIAEHFDVRDQDFRASLLKYYLFRFGREASVSNRVQVLAHADLATGKATSRVEFRVAEALRNSSLERASELGLGETDLVRGIIALAFEDVFVRENSKRSHDLELLAATA